MSVSSEMSPVPISYLFVPGSRPERFDKALAAGADVVIIDLEDAVSPSDKDSARVAVAGWLSAEKPVCLRINSVDSDWFAADLALCARPGVVAVMLPKAAAVSDIDTLRKAGARRVLPLIESAQGFMNLAALSSTDGVERLAFGSIDFSVDLGIEGDDRELDYFRSQLVLASRVAGIAPPIDGVTTAIGDVDVLASETLRGKRFGFGAKLCIHPAQVAVVHASYLPQAAEVAWAERVMAAAAGSQGAAVAVDGKMVDRPVILKAERILGQARRRSA
jgi:citrate lyase subunit beta/citryl-CoA lyase